VPEHRREPAEPFPHLGQPEQPHRTPTGHSRTRPGHSRSEPGRSRSCAERSTRSAHSTNHNCYRKTWSCSTWSYSTSACSSGSPPERQNRSRRDRRRRRLRLPVTTAYESLLFLLSELKCDTTRTSTNFTYELTTPACLNAPFVSTISLKNRPASMELANQFDQENAGNYAAFPNRVGRIGRQHNNVKPKDEKTLLLGG